MGGVSGQQLEIPHGLDIIAGLVLRRSCPSIALCSEAARAPPAARHWESSAATSARVRWSMQHPANVAAVSPGFSMIALLSTGATLGLKSAIQWLHLCHYMKQQL